MFFKDVLLIEELGGSGEIVKGKSLVWVSLSFVFIFYFVGFRVSLFGSRGVRLVSFLFVSLGFGDIT